MCVTGSHGREIIFSIVEPGEIFGEIALLDGQPRTADARATVPTSLMTIYRRDFMQLLKRQPAVHDLAAVCCPIAISEPPFRPGHQRIRPAVILCV